MTPRFALRLRPLARSIERLEQQPAANQSMLTRAALDARPELAERTPGDRLRNMGAVLLDRLEANGSCLLDDLAAAGYTADEIAAHGAEAARIAHVVYTATRRAPRRVTFAPALDDDEAQS